MYSFFEKQKKTENTIRTQEFLTNKESSNAYYGEESTLFLKKLQRDFHHNFSEIKNFLEIYFRIKPGLLSQIYLNRIKILCFHHTGTESSRFIFDILEKIQKEIIKKHKNFEIFIEEFTRKQKDKYKISPIERVEILLIASQIFNNPFESPLCLYDMIECIKSSNKLIFDTLKKSLKKKNFVKKEFTDFLMPWERDLECLTKKHPDIKNSLFQLRVDFLYQLMKKNIQKSNAPISIIGAGIAGLSSAAVCSLFNIPFYVFEKREEQQCARDNIITIGRNYNKDLQILNFLGILDLLDEKISRGHARPYVIEVKISDLEAALRKRIEHLGKLDSIYFNHEVIDIKTFDSTTHIFVKKSNGSLLNFSTQKIIIASGSKSPVCDLLSIKNIQVAATTQIAFSTFDPVEEKERALNFPRYFYKNLLRGLKFSTGLLSHSLSHLKTIEKSYIDTFPEGPTGIFRIPQQDYIIRCLKPTDHNLTFLLSHKVKSIQSKILLNPNSEKIQEWKEEKHSLENNLQLLLKQKAESYRDMLDILMGPIMRVDHSPKQMQANHNYLVDVKPGFAKNQTITIGDASCMVIGDASHITDPYCGYGGKTAIEEVLIFRQFLDLQDLDFSNNLEAACFLWLKQFYVNSMVNVGLYERNDYCKNTEFLLRNILQVIDNNHLNTQEAEKALCLLEREKTETYNIFSENDRLFLIDLMHRLENALAQLNCPTKSEIHIANGLVQVHKLAPLIEYQSLKILIERIREKTHHQNFMSNWGGIFSWHSFRPRSEEQETQKHHTRYLT